MIEVLALSLGCTSALTIEGVWVLYTTRKRKVEVDFTSKNQKKRLCIIFPSYKDTVELDKWLEWSKEEKVTYMIVEDITDLNSKFSKDAIILRRNSRKGYKAGALNGALDHLVKNKMEFDYILFFDSDHLPNKDFPVEKMHDQLEGDLIQFFYEDGFPLNGMIGWQTYSARFYSNWNIYNRSFSNLIGSAMAINYKLIKEGLRFPESITEDYALTLRELTKNNMKVKVLPYSIALSTGHQPKRWMPFFKQQERWAEGTIRDAKNYFVRVLRSKSLNVWGKIDFILHMNLYLQGLWVAFTIMLFLVFGARIAIYILPVIVFQAIVYLKTLDKSPKIYWIPFLVLNYVMMPIQIYAFCKAILVSKGEFYKTERI